MKKYIALLLVLVMGLSLFAGCAKEPDPSSDLTNATAFLYNMYKGSGSKDEAIKLTTDKNVTSVVTIDSVTYNVEWTVNVTSGAADSVSIAESSTANQVTVDIPAQPEEQIEFTLTATVKDSDGNTASVSFNYYVPAVEKVTVSGGQKVVIYNVADALYATGLDYLYTSSSGSQKHELVLTENKAEAIPLTIQENSNDTISFVTDNGLYLFCDGTDVTFVESQGEYTEFLLEAAEGGQYIKCANATFSGKPQYIELYSGYMTCYSMSEASNLDLYIFELQDAEDASGAFVPAGSGDSTGGDSTGGDSTETPSTAQLPPVTSPAAGTAYKFGMIQVQTGNTVYIAGGIDQDRYLVTTSDESAALDVYVEASGDGILISTTIDGSKVYITMGKNAEGKLALNYSATGSVFKYDSTLHCWYTNLDGADYYIGSYNTFETMSASATSYISADNSGVSQFPAGFFASDSASSGSSSTGNSSGNSSGSSSGTSNTGTSDVKDGDKIVIYNGKNSAYMTGNGYVYTSSSGSTKNQMVISTNKSDALVLTVKVSGDTISFVTADGKYLYADGTNVELVTTAGENTQFVLEAADGGYYIKCANATYSGKAQYLEIYYGYMTCYGMGTDTSIYTFQLQAA